VRTSSAGWIRRERRFNASWLSSLDPDRPSRLSRGRARVNVIRRVTDSPEPCGAYSGLTRRSEAA